MQELPKIYNPAPVEERWYPYWLSQGYFHAEADDTREPYTVVIPPPNVTGILHMGHMLNNTIQDVLVRRARMQGKNACWVPGTDHASIATEAKVVAMLKEQGIAKRDLTREQFLEHAFAWKDKYGGIILEQLKKLGCSCDWERTRFTMEPSLSAAVIDVFVDLYDKGLIYRGHRMVNWDPVARTSVSDEEVIYKEEQSKLYYVKYPLANGSGHITVATTRPETILVDVAIAVHPADERYAALIGQEVIVPLSAQAGGERRIPIIGDEAILIDFGTGCLKVTPAHDMVDFDIAQRQKALGHELPVLDIFNEDGTVNALGGTYAGMDRFKARKLFAADLEAAGLMAKVEEYQNKTGRSERTDAVIEPRLSKQWFVDMKRLAGPALEAVEDGRVRLHPHDKYINTYRHWMNNVRDWNISRQLWWGQQIPAYYLPDGTVIVARSKKEALKKARNERMLYALSEVDLTQDEDVVDTWFSSWLWPISVFDGFADPKGKDISYFYPTDTLVTAPEILFFWVARMIMAGLEYRGEVPFKDVYLTGIVRDKQGRKMSKSLGNSPDPLDLIDKFGADAVRFGMLVSSPAGNDLLYDEKYVEQGRNFCNKIWNALRLVKGWQVAPGGSEEVEHLQVADWFEGLLFEAFNSPKQAIQNDKGLDIPGIEVCYSDFKLSEGLQLIYRIFWDNFCSDYLEDIKPKQGQKIGSQTLTKTKKIFDILLRALHPYMPFITEEVWHQLEKRGVHDSICVANWPSNEIIGNENALLSGNQAHIAISWYLRHKQEQNISKDTEIVFNIQASTLKTYQTYELYRNIIVKRTGAKRIDLSYVDKNSTIPEDMKGSDIYSLLYPRSNVQMATERAAIAKDLDYARGFLASVAAKLNNEKFVANAKPDVLAREQAKHADAQAKIAALEAALAAVS